MGSPPDAQFGIEARGLRVAFDLEFWIASLRYFSASGGFAAAARAALGALPEALRAHSVEHAPIDGQFILAWRGPTETLLLTQGRAAFAELQRRLADEAQGCMVDQTGGLRVLRIEGPRGPELLCRLGAPSGIPAAGESRLSRLAELPVLTACVRQGEWLLLVERVYADHLSEWIRTTVADFR